MRCPYFIVLRRGERNMTPPFHEMFICYSYDGMYAKIKRPDL